MKALKWIGIAFGILLVLGVIGSLANPKPDEERPLEAAATVAGANAAGGDAAAAEAEPEAEPEPVNDPRITASEFAALRTGMSHAEVEQIVGSPGELMSENEMAGIRTFMVQWEGDGGFGANANAMFQDGKLIQKAQFGL